MTGSPVREFRCCCNTAPQATRPNYGAEGVRTGTFCQGLHAPKIRGLNLGNGAVHRHDEVNARRTVQDDVLVAVESAQVREALVAIARRARPIPPVAEADNDEAAIDAARKLRPDLVLIEPELSGCGGWWAIKQIQAEHWRASWSARATGGLR